MRFRLISYRSYSSSFAAITQCQISHFARLGQIDRARNIFEDLQSKTVTSWNAIVAGYFHNKRPGEAQKLFDKMPERNTISWNGLVSGYIKNGMISEARKVFDKMPERNVVSWTAMVRGYVQEGLIEEAELLFWRMPEKNVVSWTVMLGGLIEDGRVDEARRLFDMIPVKDVVASTNMIGGLCSEGRLNEAREIFDEMPQRNVVAWTSMISGYAINNKVDVARKLFEVMPDKNEVTWTAMLKGYTKSGRINEAAELFKAMPVKPVAACNEMIMGFGLNGEVGKARWVFDQMKEKDDGTWSALIKIYERKGFELEALALFRLMQSEGVRPNFPSIISILSVCGSLASLDHGRQVHSRLVRSHFDLDIYVSSVLITMYIKCGDLVTGKKVFDRFSSKDIVMWNSIIAGYAQHGSGEKALEVFHEMFSSGAAPDEITFIGVLSACGYTGKEFIKAIICMHLEIKLYSNAYHIPCAVFDLLGQYQVFGPSLCSSLSTCKHLGSFFILLRRTCRSSHHHFLALLQR
ncbi:hypothetical protein OIU77_003740 [Salix suchowensis]|uniref:Pentatricopeptide repeat-containing protein n=1 Tax=Salix suchowensis TaxID=1278906 RepID=A0ABQ9AS16_9ROSI|nr:hypothetical protein OIU77_003740 [Salix suchowensis]